MQDEHFMRGWNEGHDQFSADITRGLKRFAARFRRRGEGASLPSTPGEKGVFTHAAAPALAGMADQEGAETRPKPAST